MLRADKVKIAPLPPLSFTVANGECLAIEGPSGSGKTRLLRALADLDSVSGFVFLDGVERREIAGPAWRKRVRFASAEPVWWTETARAAFTLADSSATQRLERLVHSLGLTAADLDKPVASLSTGQRQRLALARAIIDDPAVLLLDEPVSALDKPTAALVAELIRFQLLAGSSVIVTTHEDNAVARLASVRLQLARQPGVVGAARP